MAMKAVTIGLAAIARELELDLATTKQYIEQGRFRTWKERYRLHAFTEELAAFRKSLPDSPWHIRVQDGRVVVYKGLAEGVWDPEAGIFQMRRQGLILERGRTDQTTFVRFLENLKKIEP